MESGGAEKGTELSELWYLFLQRWWLYFSLIKTDPKKCSIKILEFKPV